MRLSESVQATLVEVFQSVFSPGDELYLFGSRLRDELRGGDIDLLVSSSASIEELVASRSRFAGILSRQLEGRKVDIVLYREGAEKQPIHIKAFEEGIRLCQIPFCKVS
jgi:predicted nucleotidyltransferase